MGSLYGNEGAVRDWEFHRPYSRFYHCPASCTRCDRYSRGDSDCSWGSGVQGHWRSVRDHYLLRCRPAGRGRVYLPAADSYRANLCLLYVVCALLLWRTLSQARSIAIAAADSARANLPYRRHSTDSSKAIATERLFRAKGPLKESQ